MPCTLQLCMPNGNRLPPAAPPQVARRNTGGLPAAPLHGAVGRVLVSHPVGLSTSATKKPDKSTGKHVARRSTLSNVYFSVTILVPKNFVKCYIYSVHFNPHVLLTFYRLPLTTVDCPYYYSYMMQIKNLI
jgi:hypothetical protein